MGGRPAKVNEKKGDRDLEREIKTKGGIFLLEEQHENFVAAVTTDEKLYASGHQCKVKMSGSEKKVNENTYDISSIKRVRSFRKFQVVVVQNNGKEMYKESVLRVQSCCFFLLIRPIVVFHRSPALPSPLSFTRFYILFEETINTIETFAFSPG